MNELKLVKTRLFEGVWEGVLSGETEGTPEIEVTHLQEAVPGQSWVQERSHPQ